jgi:large subunit ribosomal protein L6
MTTLCLPSYVLRLIGKYGIIDFTLTTALQRTLLNILLHWNSNNLNYIFEIKVRVKKRGLAKSRTLWGTFKQYIKQIMQNLTFGVAVQLELVGLGYRAYIYKNYLILLLGFSHGIRYKIASDCNILCIRTTLISIFGLNKVYVCQIANEIRHLKKTEIYKGKGIKYRRQIIERKEGKKAKL